MGGAHTSLKAMRARNWTCATSRGSGRAAQPIMHVDHEPPGPSSLHSRLRSVSPRFVPATAPMTVPETSRSRLWPRCSECVVKVYGVGLLASRLRVGTDCTTDAVPRRCRRASGSRDVGGTADLVWR